MWNGFKYPGDRVVGTARNRVALHYAAESYETRPSGQQLGGERISRTVSTGFGARTSTWLSALFLIVST